MKNKFKAWINMKNMKSIATRKNMRNKTWKNKKLKTWQNIEKQHDKQEQQEKHDKQNMKT